MWKPEQSKPVTNKEFQNFVKENNNRFNQLKVNNANNNGNKNNPNGRKMKCWDCGKNGEKKGHTRCATLGTNKFEPATKVPATTAAAVPTANAATTTTHPARTPPSDAPKNGALETHTLDGFEEKCCTTCMKWNWDKRVHISKDHKKGFKQPKATVASGNLSMTDISSTSVQEALDCIQLNHVVAANNLTVAPTTKTASTMAPIPPGFAG